ncbi:hypothetical protein PVMG_05941 [Plasmodium vivax Mauritania I]|uniref:Variable surface protein n=1 Tax=Plasmodium vivax Mauritania I TaxID=1035515 RepID=A0A0J9TK21_PLAVI|nr:hypothetical protein PVMG_05941 [Plasmodium vivax Mauritania I]
MEELINNFSDFFNKYKPIFDKNNFESSVDYTDKCKTQILIYSGKTDSFSPLCIKCMKYLKHLDDNRDDDYQKRGIIYLYLLLQHYEIHNKIYDGNTIENMKKLMNSFGELHSNDTNIHNFFDFYIHNILNYKLNDLYNLYHKFYNFRNNQECTDNKCKCAKECVDTYKNSVENCNNYGNAYLCNELEYFRNIYNKDKPFQICPDVDSYLPSFIKYSTSVIILISFITISVLSSLLFILYKVNTTFIYLFIVQ